MRDSLVMYRSYVEAGELLKPNEELELYKAIFKYGFEGIEPECKPIVKAIFTTIKPQIDANNKRYENGRKGGRPKKVKDLTPEEHARHLDEITKDAM